MTTQTMEIMDVVDSLPIDMKLELIDHLLDSISPSQTEIDNRNGDRLSEPSV